jgi:phosphate uptake regulator
MRRKIVKQGVASMTISLPSAWTRKFNLNPGDEVNVESKENLLLISPEESSQKEEITIHTDKLYPLINRCALALYQKGYDQIILKATDQDQLKDMRRVVSELGGFEIVDETKNSCTLRMISGSAIEDFDNLYRRTFLILKGIIEEGYDSLKDKDLKRLIERDLDVNKFVNICIRELNKKGYKNFIKTPVLYAVILKLEELGDGYKSLFQFILKENLNLQNYHFDIYKKLVSFFQECYEFSFNSTKSKAVNIANLYGEVKVQIDEALYKSKDVNSIKVLLILRMLCDKTLSLQGFQLGFVSDF